MLVRQPISRPGYTHVNYFQVEMTDSAFEYEGVFEWPGRFDFKTVISGGSWEFLPIYEGLVRSIEHPEFSVTSQAILVNRNHIETFTHKMYKDVKRGTIDPFLGVDPVLYKW